MRPATTYVPSIRGDAMLLTHGREDRHLIAAAVLLDAVLGGQLAVSGDHVVAGPALPDTPAVLARVLDGRPGTPRVWLDRVATFAHRHTATELVTAGVATPLELRFRRHFTLSVDAHAEAEARERLPETALAAALYERGLHHTLTGDPFPPSTHNLPPAARAILTAFATSARTSHELAAA